MADPMYSGEFYIDSNFGIKPEPMGIDSVTCSTNATASMPIPTRRGINMSELRSFGMESLDTSPSSSSFQSSATGPPLYSGNLLWGTRLVGPDPEIKMDDDDIFQVDKSDLIQGPTLAELNANDETLLGDLNFDDLLLPDESSYYINVPSIGTRLSPALQISTHTSANTNVSNCASSFPPDGLGFYRDTLTSTSVPSSPLDVSGIKINQNVSPASHHSSSSSLHIHSATPSITPPPLGVSPLQHKHSTLHELLMKKDTISGSPDKHVLGQSVPGPSSPLHLATQSGGVVIRSSRYATPPSRLSSSAPTHLGLEQIWQRREPRPHLLSTSSLAEAGSTSSLSTGMPHYTHHILNNIYLVFNYFSLYYKFNVVLKNIQVF